MINMTTKSHSKRVRAALAVSVLAAASLLPLAGCDRQGETAGNEPQAVPVTATTVEARTLEETVRGIGTLRAPEQVEIRSELAGRITEIGFEEGKRVEQDQVLFRLDARILNQEARAREAELAAARARMQETQSTAERFASLVETNAVSEDEYETAQSDYEAARAEVDRLEAELARTRERLDDATIVAPFAGVISESLVDVGDFVEVGETLATLYRTDFLEVSFTLPERYMGRVRLDQPIVATVAAYPERTFEGRVSYVSPSVSEQTRDFRVKAAIENSENLLRPGMFATAVVTVDVHRNRPVVPEQALVATRTGYIVFVIDDDQTARERQVTLGIRKPGIAEISEGVTPGERVVQRGHINLSNSAPVEITETEPLAPTRDAGDGAPTALTGPAAEGNEKP